MTVPIVGGVGVEVFPTSQSFARKLRDDLVPAADRVGTDVGRTLAERIQSALGSARVNVDSAVAMGEIERVREDIRRLGADDARINVNVDTAGASVHLDEFKAKLDSIGDKTVHVRVDDGGSSSAARGGMSGLVAAAIGLGPALIPVAAAAIPLIAGIGAAAVGAGAGVGVLALAFHGIGAAVSALGAQSHQTGQQLALQSSQQLASADSILNAQDAVKAAVQGVADARRSAALSVQNAEQGVLSAEQALTSAQYNETQAQLSLTQARRQAAQTLQDLSNQVKDGALTQRQATLDLQTAQQNLTVVDFNPHSTAQQRAEAQLAVDQAKQRLAEVGLANQRLAQQKALADKQGVANAPTVLAAEHAVTDATQSRVNAQQNLIRAQAAVVEAQRAGAEQVAKADQQVVQSQRALAQAYASAGAQGSASVNKVAEAMAGLSPAGRAFALFVNDKLRPALHSLTDAAQSGLLPGLQAALTILLPYLPDFAKFIGAIGREMGNMAVQAAKAFTSPWWRQFFGFLADMAQSALPVLGTVLLNLATGFAGLFQALAPAGGGLGGAVEGLTKRFADFATHLTGSGGFQKFMQYIKDNTPNVTRLLSDLGTIFGKLIVGLAPWGSTLLDVIRKLADFLAKLSPGQLAAIASGIAGFLVVKNLIGPIKSLIDVASGIGKAFSFFADNPILAAVALIVIGLIYAYTHFKTFRDIVNTVWRDIEIAAKWLWKNVLDPFFTWIGDHWHYVATAFKLYWDYYLHPVLEAFWVAIKFLWNDVLVPAFGAMKLEWHILAAAFSLTYNDVLKPLWSAFSTAFSGVSKAFSGFRDGLSSIWGDIKSIFISGYNFVTQNVLNKFIDAINKVTGILGVPSIPDIGAISTSAAGGAAGGGVGSGGGNAKRFTFAHGGVVPGFAPGSDVVDAKLSPGEGVLVPEAVRALGAGFVHAVNKQFSNRSSTPGHFAGGGVVSSILSGGADAALTGAEAPIKALIHRLRPRFVHDLAGGGFNSIDHAIRSWVGSHATAGPNLSGTLTDLTHQALIKAALRFAGVADTPGNEGDVNIIVSHESGWNPNAINLTDSNARAGHPSQGLMQTIPSTFNAWRLPSLSASITDPIANLVAGIRYAVGRYGSLDDVPGVRGVHTGGKYVGYDNGGFLPPGISQVYNGTGRPEPVFTDAQWAKLTGAQQPRQQPKIADHVSIHGPDAETVLTELLRRQQMAMLAP